ncbi:MAG: hypothetical protein ACOCXQ_04400 [Patescibacteria group bacterium]
MVEERTKTKLISEELRRLRDELDEVRNIRQNQEITLEVSRTQGSDLVDTFSFLIPDIITTRESAVRMITMLRQRESELEETIARYTAGDVSEDELIALEANKTHALSRTARPVQRVAPTALPENVSSILGVCMIGVFVAFLFLVLLAVLF